MRRLKSLFGWSLACLFAVRCNGGGGDVTTPTQVVSVRVTPEDATRAVGRTAEFTAVALDAGENVLPDKTFTFRSSDEAVATIADPAANPATVTAVAAGSATITATTEGKSGTARFDVSDDIQITGTVVDGETGAGIPAAVVDWNAEVAGGRGSTSTGGDGGFSFALPSGSTSVSVLARAAGYVRTTLGLAQVRSPSTQLEPILLVRETSMKGYISGTVRNARNNQGIRGATVALLKGQTVEGPQLNRTTSDQGGGFAFTQLDAGTYTLYVGKEGFNPNKRTAITVLSGATRDQDVILSPFGASEIRIVLTWGAAPTDLDAHLTGPNPDGTRFHVYWPSGSQGGLFAPPFAALDVDDVSSFGPETITITQMSSGTYRYSVHDFSNRSSATSTALGTSGARVQVYIAEKGIVEREFFVPNQRGTLWTVFELSGDKFNPTITPRNTMGLAEDPDGIALRTPLVEGGEGDETDAGLIGRAIRALEKPVER